MIGLAILYAVVGLAVGPLLAAAVRQLPADQPIWSRCCVACRARVGLTGLLGGPCPTCGAKDGRVLWISLASAVIFGLLWLRFGPTPILLLQSVYMSIFLVLFVVDVEHHWIPDRVVLPAAAFAALAGSLTRGPVATIAGGAIGFGILALLFGLGVLLSRQLGLPADALGAGDVKLAAFIGFATGWPAILGGLFIGFLLGGLVSLVLVALRIARWRSYIPYAPFLLSGGAVMLVDAPRLVRALLGG